MGASSRTGLLRYVASPSSKTLTTRHGFLWWRIDKNNFSSSTMVWFPGRFKNGDIPSAVSKGAPDFCTIYVISKGKISSMRSASRPAPSASALYSQVLTKSSSRSSATSSNHPQSLRGRLFISSFSYILHSLTLQLQQIITMNKWNLSVTSNQKTIDHQPKCRISHGTAKNPLDSKYLNNSNLYISECVLPNVSSNFWGKSAT